MGDELLEALAKRQRELDEGEPTAIDAVDGDAGEALLDGLFAELDTASKPPRGSGPDEVVELSKRRAPVWPIAAVVLAAAAALLLWFSRPASVPALPEYRAVSVAGGAATVRGEDDAVATSLELRGPSEPVRLEFAAATPVDRKISVSLLARPASGSPVFSRIEALEVSKSGSFRIRGPLDRFIELSEGQWTLEVIISPASHAPTSAAEAASGDWQRIAIDVIIAAP